MNFLEKILGDNYTQELGNLVLDQLLDEIADADIEIDDDTLSEKDFYPPEDNRTLHSNVFDIDETNNFNQFASEFFDLCDEEEFY